MVWTQHRQTERQRLVFVVTDTSSHTLSIAFRHIPPKKDVVNQCLEFDLAHVYAGSCICRQMPPWQIHGLCWVLYLQTNALTDSCSMLGLVSANKCHGRVTVLYRQAVMNIKLCNALSGTSVTSTLSRKILPGSCYTCLPI